MAGGILQYLRTLTGAGDGTDRQLLARFASDREEAAFTALLERYGPMVWGVCRRVLSDSAEAEDAFQATFVVLACKARSISRPELLGNWLFGVATRTALKARVASRRRPRGGLDVDRIPDPATDATLWHDLRPVLDEEISRLPERYRVPFVLCHLQGATNAEAAKQLDCPLGTVLSRLARARERLRARLTRRGVTLSTAALGTLLEARSAPSAALQQTTTAAAMRVVAGLVLIEAVAAPVALLAREVLRAMFIHKLRQTVSLFLGLALLVAGAGLLARQTLGASQLPESPPRAKGKTQPAGDVDWAPWKVVQISGKLVPEVLNGVGSVALSQKGDFLFTGGQAYAGQRMFGEVRAYDVRTGERRWARDGHTGAAAAVALSPDGRTLASGSADKSLVLWDAATGERQRSLKGHTDFVRAAAFSPDSGTLASGGYDRTVRLWDVRTGELKKTLVGHELHVFAVTFAPNGSLLSAAGDDNGRSSVKLWETRTGELKRELTCDADHECFLAVAFSPDGKYLAAGSSVPGDSKKLFGKVRVWETATWKLRRTFDQPGAVGFVAFARDGITLASNSAAESLIYLWDVRQGERRQALTGHTRPVSSLAFCGEGDVLASCSTDGTVRLWRPSRRVPPPK